MAVNATSGTSLNSSTGLGQGIDVNTFVQSALSFDQANINQLQTQQTIVNAQTKALSKITSDPNAPEPAVFSLKVPLASPASQPPPSSITIAQTPPRPLSKKGLTAATAPLAVIGVPISSTPTPAAGVINAVPPNLPPAPQTSSVPLPVSPNTSKATAPLNQFLPA